MARKYGVRLLDFHRDRKILVNVPKPLSLKRICVAETSYNMFRISVAKLKTHTLAGISLSLKI